MYRTAIFSECRTFRYSLGRIWDASGKMVLFIGLNPSYADETIDDPTIRRCIGFAKEWGFGGLSIVNLFAYCSHNPKELLKVKDPVGHENDKMLKKYISQSDKIILVWGNQGNYLKRNEKVLKLIKKPLCLKINKNGAPAHPFILERHFKTDTISDSMTINVKEDITLNPLSHLMQQL